MPSAPKGINRPVPYSEAFAIRRKPKQSLEANWVGGGGRKGEIAAAFNIFLPWAITCFAEHIYCRISPGSKMQWVRQSHSVTETMRRDSTAAETCPRLSGLQDFRGVFAALTVLGSQFSHTKPFENGVSMPGPEPSNIFCCIKIKGR